MLILQFIALLSSSMYELVCISKRKFVCDTYLIYRFRRAAIGYYYYSYFDDSIIGRGGFEPYTSLLETLGDTNQLSYKAFGEIGDYYVCHRLVDMVDFVTG